MKTFKQITESVSEDTEALAETVKEIADELRSKYGFETSIKRSRLGRVPSYFLDVFGPKDTWTNGIALNSPVNISIGIQDGTVDMNRMSYQMRNAGVKKMRKFKPKSNDELKKKIFAYIAKNADAMKGLL